MSNQELLLKALKEIDHISWDEHTDSDAQINSIQSILYSLDQMLDHRSLTSESVSVE